MIRKFGPFHSSVIFVVTYLLLNQWVHKVAKKTSHCSYLVYGRFHSNSMEFQSLNFSMRAIIRSTWIVTEAIV